MRPLAIMMAGVGLAVGMLAAIGWQDHRLVHGNVAWATYAPANSNPLAQVPADWWPVAFVSPAGGALLGLGVAALMSRFGWRLTRQP